MTASPERRGSFTIALTGDVMLGRLVAEVIDQKGMRTCGATSCLGCGLLTCG
jgi:hypothetical protein